LRKRLVSFSQCNKQSRHFSPNDQQRGCQPVFTKKARACLTKRQKKPNTSFKAYSDKTCIIKHKIDIKTRQKHQYNYITITILRSIFFPSNYTVLHLFLVNNIDHF